MRTLGARPAARSRSRRSAVAPALRGLVAACGLVLAVATARAEKPVDAKEMLRRANAHYNLGRFLEAAKEYEALYESHPDQPVLLYDVAQAYRQGGDAEKALFFYRSYLRNWPEAPNRADVSQRVAQLEKVVEAARTAQQAPPNDTASPGSTPHASTTPAPTQPTPAPTTPPPAAVATATAPAPAPAAQPIYKKWWVWAAVGAVVVVAVGVGVGVGVATSGPSFSSNTGADIGPGAGHSAALLRF